jgi:uncharacterized membrane protein
VSITTLAERRRDWPVLCDSGTASKTLLNASIATFVCAAVFCIGIISTVFHPDYIGNVLLVCVSAYFFYDYLTDAIWALDVLDIHDEMNAMSTHHIMKARQST